MPAWLNDAIFYEIYPQSFYDANGDGIGDLEGIIQKLDYIRDLGCNALWINPCFDSPFKDAGYDVRDYKKIAPRYGSNEDIYRLFAEARRKGIRVLLDLVCGHTSEEHEWFRMSRQPRRNEYWNRYIWTGSWETWASGLKTVLGAADRNGAYIVNFFQSQPALNYGFYKPDKPWQLPMNHPDCMATRRAMKDVMRFWLDAGCDGFRVDMASSLVKFDDPENSGTAAIWRDVRSMLDAEYPDAAIIAEWSHPRRALNAGFHGDFFLAFHENSGYKSLFREYAMDADNAIAGGDNSFFKKDGTGGIGRFLDDYLAHYEAVRDLGHICLVTGNHDLPRLALNLSPRELALAYAFIFTMPGVPFLYYGDEIGMRYLNLVSKEGGYHRTGSRTPMQWSEGKNKGFSPARAEDLYLPVDASPDAPSVEAQERNPDSLLNTVKALLALRRREPDLRANPNLEVLYGKGREAGKCREAGETEKHREAGESGKNGKYGKGSETEKRPFVYRRGTLVLAVNPGAKPATVALSVEAGEPVFTLGRCDFAKHACSLEGQSFGIWRIKTPPASWK